MREFSEIFELLLPSELSQSHLDRLDRTQWSKNAKTSKRQKYLKCLHGLKRLFGPSHFSGYSYIFGMDSLIHFAAPLFKRAANLNNNSPLRSDHTGEWLTTTTTTITTLNIKSNLRGRGGGGQENRKINLSRLQKIKLWSLITETYHCSNIN